MGSLSDLNGKHTSRWKCVILGDDDHFEDEGTRFVTSAYRTAIVELEEGLGEEEKTLCRNIATPWNCKGFFEGVYEPTAHKFESRLKVHQEMTTWRCTTLVALMKPLEDNVEECSDLARESRWGGITYVRQMLGKAGSTGAFATACMFVRCKELPKDDDDAAQR